MKTADECLSCIASELIKAGGYSPFPGCMLHDMIEPHLNLELSDY